MNQAVTLVSANLLIKTGKQMVKRGNGFQYDSDQLTSLQ